MPRQQVVLALLAILVGCGCGQSRPPTDHFRPGPWEAVNKFEGVGEDGMNYFRIVLAANNGNWSEAQQVAASSEFADLLNEFAASEIPADWESSAPARDEVIASGKRLIETARTGSEDDFQGAYIEFTKTFRAMKMRGRSAR